MSKDLTTHWRCDGCGKRSRRKVRPFGRCHLCGEQLGEVGPPNASSESDDAIYDAIRGEVEAYLFYVMAAERVEHERARAVLVDLAEREREHAVELAGKYDVELDEGLFSPDGPPARAVADDLFGEITEEDAVCMVFDRALDHERKAHEKFLARAAELPDGPMRELFRELAAEELDHIALLESECEHCQIVA